MKQITILNLLAIGFLLATGCTTFKVRQTDESPNERIITSEIRATAWFSSAQAIAGIKALQTDKSQSFGTDSIRQQGATNAAAIVEAAFKGLAAGLK
jgi:hypothetical protein